MNVETEYICLPESTEVAPRLPITRGAHNHTTGIIKDGLRNVDYIIFMAIAYFSSFLRFSRFNQIIFEKYN